VQGPKANGTTILTDDNNFYGTTSLGGALDFGTVFQMTPSGQLTTLVRFSGTGTGADRGDTPVAALIVGKDGNLYGTTSGGGTNGKGTVFRVARDGTGFTTLIDFADFNIATPSAGERGAAPRAALVEDRDTAGTFYGTTSAGGSFGQGTVYRLVVSGNGATISAFDFTGANGARPEASLIQARNTSVFFGTAAAGGSGNGTVFRFDPSQPARLQSRRFMLLLARMAPHR
jgi:uncharacterized repeat protein (TIGR03803 family)